MMDGAISFVFVARSSSQVVCMSVCFNSLREYIRAELFWRWPCHSGSPLLMIKSLSQTLSTKTTLSEAKDTLGMAGGLEAFPRPPFLFSFIPNENREYSSTFKSKPWMQFSFKILLWTDIRRKSSSYFFTTNYVAVRMWKLSDNEWHCYLLRHYCSGLFSHFRTERLVHTFLLALWFPM